MFRPSDLPELMTPSEVAHLFGVHPRTVLRWGVEGLLGSRCFTPGGRVRYRREVVLRLYEQQKGAL